MDTFKRKEAHQPHRPGKLGLFFNSFPEKWKWCFPVYASRQLHLKEYEICSSKVPAAFDGLRIAYASDVHYGALLGEARVTDLAQRLNALKADVIILGGDYGEDAKHSFLFLEKLPPLEAKLAVCGVVGNHDRAEGTAEELSAAMEKRGITPLVNSSLMLKINGKTLCICATDDVSHGNPKFSEVKAQAEDADFVIYVPHAPDALQAAKEEGAGVFYDLALCGHTHGGQVSLFGFAPYTASLYGNRYGNMFLSGHKEEDGAHVIISNGVGTTWMPLRLGAKAQYHLITLRRK
ncbi:MAG: metallophosphoesterase [Clostridia bacterium]|nr:metallophosphoesterase [Clostridia bacterium]